MSHSVGDRKKIVASDGEDVFQVRYLQDESVGLLTTAQGRSYLILDSMDYWYDVTQEQYPAKKKCSCKNEWFHVCFRYFPRKGTEDFEAVDILTSCTACGKERRIARVTLNYSPTAHLFSSPITPCENPKLKYRTYEIGNDWTEEQFFGLLSFLSEKHLQIACWHFLPNQNKRALCSFTAEELKDFLEAGHSYLAIYFSMDPLEEMFDAAAFDDQGIYIKRDFWRKANLFQINAPIAIGWEHVRYWHSIQFCSEWIACGKIVPKNEAFVRLADEAFAYCKEHRLG